MKGDCTVVPLYRNKYDEKKLSHYNIFCVITPNEEFLFNNKHDKRVIIIKISEMLHSTRNSLVEVEAAALADETSLISLNFKTSKINFKTSKIKG